MRTRDSDDEDNQDIADEADDISSTKREGITKKSSLFQEDDDNKRVVVLLPGVATLLNNNSNSNGEDNISMISSIGSATDDVIDEGIDGGGGAVRSRRYRHYRHYRGQQQQQQRQNNVDVDVASYASMPTIFSAGSASPSVSSWATNDDISRYNNRNHLRRKYSYRGGRRRRMSPLRLRRTKTPTTNNLSSMNSDDNTRFYSEQQYTTNNNNRGYFDENDEVDNDADDHNEDLDNKETTNEKKKTASKIKNWLSESMLETMNIIAGVTLSTTGKIVKPPLAVTKNILLPAMVAIIIDVMETVTPILIQDWFKIVSSSLYHFFHVFLSGSTVTGTKFRKQSTVVAQSFMETISAPECQQAVIDTVTTGIKLIDVVATPESQLLLEQLSILGCRYVDVLSSGKSKAFIHNMKDLIWTGIEVLHDPTTTLALAEVTAHLCHALEEFNDEENNTTTVAATAARRSVRDAQNKVTYLNNPCLISNNKHPHHDSIEQIILSSLGMMDNNTDHDTKDDSSENNKNNNSSTPNTSSMIYNNNDIDDDNIIAGNAVNVNDDNNNVDETTAVESIPSNVAFPKHDNNTTIAISIGTTNTGTSLNNTLGALHLEQQQQQQQQHNNGNISSSSSSNAGTNFLEVNKNDGVTVHHHNDRPLLNLDLLQNTIFTAAANKSKNTRINSVINNNNEKEDKEKSNENDNTNDQSLVFENGLKTMMDTEELIVPGDDRLDFQFRKRQKRSVTTATTPAIAPYHNAKENNNNNNPNLKKLYDKFEKVQTKELQEPSYVQFYNAIDDLLEQKRNGKRMILRKQQVEEGNNEDKDTNLKRKKNGMIHHGRVIKQIKPTKYCTTTMVGSVSGTPRTTIVKDYYANQRQEQQNNSTFYSKAAKEKYVYLRRLWKYPPLLLWFSTIVGVFWIGFGLYGMYTVFHQVLGGGFHHPDSSSSDSSGSRSRSNPPISRSRSNHPIIDNADDKHFDESSYTTLQQQHRETNNPNEIVIRIMKEVIHLHEDGRTRRIGDDELNNNDNEGASTSTTRTRTYDGNNNNDHAAQNNYDVMFSPEELEKMKECVASSYL